MMPTIGAFNETWANACGATERKVVRLYARPATAFGDRPMPSANAPLADKDLLGQLHSTPIDLLLDTNGAGCRLIEPTSADGSARPAHEIAGILLVSYFLQPVSTALRHLPPDQLWGALQGTAWVKAVADIDHAEELRRFGVPNVVAIPPAAPDHEYDIDPLSEPTNPAAVSFVGDQQTGYFRPGLDACGADLPPAVVGQVLQSATDHVPFVEVYADQYRFGRLPSTDDAPPERLDLIRRYFDAKLHYHAALWVARYDRFVIFLRRKLGDSFAIFGRGWDRAYGLPCSAPPTCFAEHIRHWRRTPINVVLPEGWGEAAIPARLFDITAAGGLVLCYHQPGLDACFEIGHECETFRNEAELLEKIDTLLRDDVRRREIAAAGQRRALRDHLWSHRLATLEALAADVLEPSLA